MSLPSSQKVIVCAKKPTNEITPEVGPRRRGSTRLFSLGLLRDRLDELTSPRRPASPSPQTFVLKEVPVPELKDGEILVETEYMCVPPHPPHPTLFRGCLPVADALSLRASVPVAHALTPVFPCPPALHSSHDPAQRTWIQKGLDPVRAYGPYIEEGEPMPAIILGKGECAAPPGKSTRRLIP